MLVGYSGSKLVKNGDVVEKLSTYLSRCQDVKQRGQFLMELSNRFPYAPRIVSVDGANIKYKFVDGEAGFEKANLNDFGRIVKELHSLSLEYSPEKETGMEWLKGLAEKNLRDSGSDLEIAAIVLIFTKDEQVVIHGEITDLVVSSDGRITILDWDEAGLGTKYQDLGYVYFKCHEQRNGDADFQKFLEGYDDSNLDDKKIMKAAGLIAIAYSHWANTEFRIKFGISLLAAV